MSGASRTWWNDRAPAVFVMIGLVLSSPAAWGKKGGPPLDYTKGERPEGKLVDCKWALGPTGAFGYIHTTDSRQILIEDIAEGSPADGKLQKGDVILGIVSPTAGQDTGKGAFTLDARRSLGTAVEEAEKKTNGGKLVLNVWRSDPSTELKASGTRQIALTLPVLGSYSATSPWTCKKTDRLIDQAAQDILKRSFFVKKRNNTTAPRGSIWAYLDALGLLATGDEAYISAVGDYARALAKAEEGRTGAMNTWGGAYKNVFLTEYYLATGDKAVLPGITSLATVLARGVSGVGTWSHGTADIEKNGMYGPPGAYGAMNQASMVCALSLVLAQKCGVKEPLVDEAIKRALNFLKFYTDKGTIPYGDHDPRYDHDNNGRMSIGAVLYDLAGHKKDAEYCVRMTLASYGLREAGHTGHFFAWQWGALGAARGGPEAAQSYIRNTRWFTEVERRADGSSWYQPQLSDPGKYRGWSTSGQRLMQHCLPRKALLITGKGGGCIPVMTPAEVKSVAAAGLFHGRWASSKALVARMSKKQLFAALGNWSLVVRGEAAKELGRREEHVVKELISMLNSSNRYARYGACTGLQYAGRQSEEAVDALIDKIENDTDMTLRFFAINALMLPRRGAAVNGLGSVSRKATPTLLKLAAVDDREQDATRKLTRQIASVLFYGGNVRSYTGYFPKGKGLEKADKSLLLPALKDMLSNPNGGARSEASAVYSHLNPEDLEQLWGDVYRAATEHAPSGVMFANGVLANSVTLIAKNRFKEGLPLAHAYLLQEGWNKHARVPAAYTALSYYGSAAKTYLPDIEKEWVNYQKRKGREVARCKKAFDTLIENMDKPVELKSIQPYLKDDLKK